jgi:hypothetical protein
VPRALSWTFIDLPAPEKREPTLSDLRERRDRLVESGCRYWLFRSTNDATVLEFTEAADEATLVAGHANAGIPARPIFIELELS